MIEEKFKQFRQSITPKEFDSVDFLTQKAEELKPSDAQLAERILLRAKRLRAQTIKKKFQKFQQSVTPQQFRSTNFLARQAEVLKDSDPELGERILVRVKSLQKQAIEQGEISSQKALKSEVTDKKEVITSESTSENNEPEKESSEPFKLGLFFAKYPKLENTINYLQQHPFIALVIIPSLIFSFYQCLWASDRYESQAQVIVQEPDSMATMDAGLAILSGFGLSTGKSDPELVAAYIYSNDMLNYLDKKLNLREHYSQTSIDMFSRIHSWDTQEKFLTYYQQHVTVEIDEKSGVISIFTQAFTPEYAKEVTNLIVNRAEWYINDISHQLAEAQLDFIKGEHKIVEDRMKLEKSKLLDFQQRYGLLDPTAEGMAMQKIAYTIEGEIAAKTTELKTLQALMSNSAPQVQAVKNELQALQAQLKTERNKLSSEKDDGTPVSEILTKFADYKINVELALKAYASSQISLEKSRMEAYKQIKFLVVVEEATMPEDNKYPEILYNITLFFVLLSIVFGVGRIIHMTIKELK